MYLLLIYIYLYTWWLRKERPARRPFTFRARARLTTWQHGGIPDHPFILRRHPSATRFLTNLGAFLFSRLYAWRVIFCFICSTTHPRTLCQLQIHTNLYHHRNHHQSPLAADQNTIELRTASSISSSDWLRYPFTHSRPYSFTVFFSLEIYVCTLICTHTCNL